MTEQSSVRILEILRIPLYTGGPSPPLAKQSGGLSLFDALRRTDYAAVRKEITASDLVPLLKSHPELVDQWTLFSENQRCDGWWIDKETCNVGWFTSIPLPFIPRDRRKPLHFESLEEAVAEFVVRKLDDTWALMNDPRSRQRWIQIQILILFLLAACLFAAATALYIYYRRDVAPMPRILGIAREAVGAREPWLDGAVFEEPIHNADGSWTVHVERLPRQPGGHRTVNIGNDGKVKEYSRGL